MIKSKKKITSNSYNRMSNLKYRREDNDIGLTESIINTVSEPMLILNKDLRILLAGNSFLNLFKLTTEETNGKLIYDLGNHVWDIPELRELLETILPERISVDDYKIKLNIPDIGKCELILNAKQIQIGAEKEKAVL
ncbi:MAG: PAS domain-containing protein, partial [Ignavibacteriaceae bacterium]